MHIIPAIDIQDSNCVRLTQGDYSRSVIYSNDPYAISMKWISEGATNLHIVDLDGARESRTVNSSTIYNICNAAIDSIVQVGGGIRTKEVADTYIKNGVQRLIIGTSATNDIGFLEWLMGNYGEDSLIVSVDARNGIVEVDGWTRSSGIEAMDLIRTLVDIGVTRFLYTDILRDGMLSEPNYQYISSILENFDINLQAAGGISSTDQLIKLADLGVESAIVGKAIYTGAIDLNGAINLLRDN
jgi:phosphoribosylformimino-5-aminoimidazole carboxamide ribotide isomerase